MLPVPPEPAAPRHRRRDRQRVPVRHQQDVFAGVGRLEPREEAAESRRNVDDRLAFFLFFFSSVAALFLLSAPRLRGRPPVHVARVLDPHRLVVVVALELEAAKVAFPQRLVRREAGLDVCIFVVNVFKALDADGRGGQRGRFEGAGKGRGDDEERRGVD